MNAVRIFNEKEVDELIFLDISATPSRRGPDYELIADIASEAFMPLAYGGGVGSVEDAKRLFGLGIEKIVLNTAALESPSLVSRVAEISGRQSVVVCLDVARSFWGRSAVTARGGRYRMPRAVEDWARTLVEAGAGELVVQSVDRDGTMLGYDIDLLRRISSVVSVPVVALGGCRGLEDMRQAVDEGGAAAVSAGSYFVFHGVHRAVLITYPERPAIESALRKAAR
jgi:cyclase